NTANSDDGFTSALSQYMFALDSDALASQYYGNMAHMNELGDRLPRPMNSTLPLFSPSVAHGRRLGRTRSVQGGDVLAGRVRGSAGALQRLEEDACMQDIEAPPSTAAMGHAATFPSAPVDFPPGACVLEPGGAPSSDSEHTDSQRKPVSNAEEHAEPPVETHSERNSQSPLHDESTESLATAETGEKSQGLGVQFDSRPSSQVRSRRSQHAGPTQYTPAASAKKKTAVVRGAPGLSYMFSPTIASSRPSSVVGVPTPTLSSRMQTVQPLGGCEETVPEVAEASDQKADSAENAPLVRKAFGSINIGALEQFLDEGEIPESTSDE
ncbi:hypothetical protein LPJ73_009334, partial [Coemansia sp. RSA 2703]